jgi:large subunit ribosomal protein L21
MPLPKGDGCPVPARLHRRRRCAAVYAIIKTGGKQYRVEKSDVIYVEKLDAQEGDEVQFDVMLVGKDEGAVIGKPLVAGASVTGKVVKQVKSAKILVYKYKAKKNERKRQGHRQPYTKVEITAINA